jgi:hypothetical protein
MNKLKVKTTIRCNTCGCTLKRSKTITVSSSDKAEAVKEAEEKLKIWKDSLINKNCKVCESIIKNCA